jgi:galactose oxidase
MLGSRVCWACVGALTLLPSSVFGQSLKDGTSIAKCHTDETSFPADSGDNPEFLICPDANYIGTSASKHEGYANATACAALCADTDGCAKAVLDNGRGICHLKPPEPATSLYWRAQKGYTTIRRPEKLDPGVKGRWSDLIRLPLIPVAAIVVPSHPRPSEMLYFSSFANDSFSGPTGKTQFGELHLDDLTSTQREVDETRHDMFCPAISQLEDGRIIISGGSNAEAVSIYDPPTRDFVRAADMVKPRGYQSSTTLSDGKVFTIGGGWSGPRGGKNGEVFDPSTGKWKWLEDADVTPMLTTDRQGSYRADNHAWLVGWKNASIFQAGPSMKQHWYGIQGNGSVAEAGTRDEIDDAMCGVWALYDAVEGKIFSAFGSPDYTDSPAVQRAHITTIGDPFKPVTNERVADGGFPRAYADASVLPDGTILVTGGQRRAVAFTDTDGILVAELFDPESGNWTQLAPQAVPRNYHSVNILLPDARVFSGGGGLCYVQNPGDPGANCDRSVDHADGQIFSPPYLFNEDGSEAKRPVITDLAETSVKAGDDISFTVSGSDGSYTYSLLRIGTATHSVNTDQRRIPLRDITTSGGKITATLPGDYGVLLPGWYYLFAISGSGTPSLARSVHVVL